MLDNLTVRNKFLVAGVVPAVLLVTLAILAFASAGSPVLGVVAGLAVPMTLAIAFWLGDRTGRRVAELTEAISSLDLEPGQIGVGDSDANDGSGDGDDGAEPDPADDAGSAASPTAAAAAGDEIGRLATAAAELMQRAAASAADHHEATATKTTALLEATVREGLDLVGAQLDEIDALESTEDDAERLDRLFLLDHLTARLNRGLGRLLVLAGNDSIRSRSAPAPVVDVIRVAMGENATYRNIELRTLDDVLIAPTAACELAQLLSELLANSTASSDLDTPTEVFAAHLDDGSYRVTIIDRGTGVDAAELDAARSIVRNPLEIAQLPDTRIGLNVVGRLARHLGAEVDFSATAGSGLTVDVRVPAELVSAMPSSTIASPAESEGAAGDEPDRDRRDRRDAAWPSASPKLAGRAASATNGNDSTANSNTANDSTANDSTANGNGPSGNSANGTLGNEAAAAAAGTEAWTPPALPPRVGSLAGLLDTAALESLRPEPEEPAAPIDASSIAAADAHTTTPDANGAAPAPPADETTATDQATGDSTGGTAAPTAGGDGPSLPDPEGEGWTPPALPPRGSGGLATSVAAAPTGPAPGEEPARHDSSKGPAVLTRRRRSEKKAPASTASPVQASNRSPKESRSLITSYRKGLRDGRKESPPTG